MGRYKKGKNWYIDYYYRGIRKREMIGPNRQQAETVLAKRKVEIAENRFLDIKKQAKVRFSDFTKTFLELHSKPNKKSWREDTYTLGILNSFFGKKYLYEITQKDVEEFKAKRRNEVTPATVNRGLALLKVIYTKAIEWGKVETSPAKNVKFYRENNARLVYLEKEEIERLIEACAEHLRPIVILALNTGMRREEMLSLKWQDIDFKRDIVYLLNTKSGRKREVPMNSLVKETLIKVHKHPKSPYLFCGKDGSRYGSVKKSFLTSLKKAGIMRKFRFHDLRHTFASQLVMAGVDLNTVRELLGHRDLKMTLRYAHLSPDHKRRAVELLSNQMDTNRTPNDILEILEKMTPSQPIATYRG